VGNRQAMVRRMGIPGQGLGPMRALPGAQMDDIDHADVLLVIGGDPCTQQPVTELRLRKARRRGAKVSIISPRPSALDPSCEALRTVPGHLMDAAGAIRERLDGSRSAIVLWDEADLAAEPDAAALIAGLVNHTPGARAIEMSADVSGPGLRALGIDAAGDLLAAMDAGEIDVLLTINADPTAGPAGDRWAGAIAGVGTIIAMDSHASGITGHADLVLPLLTPLEEEGVLVSMAGRAQRMRPAARECQGAAAAWEILIGLTHRLGRPVPDRTPAQAFARLATRHAAFAGLDYEALGTHGVAIAQVEGGAPDTSRREPEGDGLMVVPCTPVFGDATAHRSDALSAVLEHTRVGLSPAEASRLGVLGDARVRIATPYGEGVLPLQVDGRLHEGAAYLVAGDPTERALRLLPMDGGPVRATVTAVAREEVSA